MTEQRLPWYKRFPADFIASTVGMSWEVKCAYSLVLDLIYLGGGSIADDGAWVANMLGVGMSVRRWNFIKAELIERGKLRLVDGRIYNPRSSRELGKPIPESQKSGENETITPKSASKNKIPEAFFEGEKTAQELTGSGQAQDLVELSGQKTGQKTPDPGPVPARARENRAEQSRVDTSLVDAVVPVERIAEALGQKRGKYWATDYLRLIEEGLEFDDILEAAKAHRGGPIKGLNALAGLARRKRDDRVYQRRTPAPAPQADKPPDPTTLTDRDWENALVLLLNVGGWNEAKHGPPPTRPGHLVPPGPYEGWLKLWKLQGEHPVREYDEGTNLVEYPAERPDPFMRSMWQPEAKAAR